MLRCDGSRGSINCARIRINDDLATTLLACDHRYWIVRVWPQPREQHGHEQHESVISEVTKRLQGLDRATPRREGQCTQAVRAHEPDGRVSNRFPAPGGDLDRSPTLVAEVDVDCLVAIFGDAHVHSARLAFEHTIRCNGLDGDLHRFGVTSRFRFGIVLPP
jgi:hypothetical protein